MNKGIAARTFKFGEWECDGYEIGCYNVALFVGQISAAMRKRKITQSDLARAWGKSRQYVSRIIRGGNPSMTAKTMAELCVLVGLRLEIKTHQT